MVVEVSRPASRVRIAAVLTAVAVLVAGVLFVAHEVLGSSFSGTLSAGPATCPSTSEQQPSDTRADRSGEPLLPPEPTVAHLCIYRLDPNELYRTHTVTGNVGELVDYLNGLPETAEEYSAERGTEIICAESGDGAGAAPYLVVVGYAEGFAVVRQAGCGSFESMGAVRFDDGMAIFDFFGIKPRDAWPPDRVAGAG